MFDSYLWALFAQINAILFVRVELFCFLTTENRKMVIEYFRLPEIFESTSQIEDLFFFCWFFDFQNQKFYAEIFELGGGGFVKKMGVKFFEGGNFVCGISVK